MLNDELNLDDFPKELILLLNLISDQGEEIEKDNKQDYDWSLFLELVMHHRLFPGLISKLKHIETGEIPSYVIHQLKVWNQINTFKMLQLSAEMEKVNQMLHGYHINVLFLKGPFLADILYGDFSLRTSGDLDFLISIEDLKKVEVALTNMGYIKDDYIESVLNDWKWRHHHFSFIHPETKIKLEVHWRLNPGPGKEPNFKTLWANKQVMGYSDLPCFYLGNEDLCFFLITHGARHGWSRLRWLYDIHQLTKKNIDWHKVKGLFEKYHFLPVAGQALILSKQLLNTNIEIPAQLLDYHYNKSLQLAKEALFYIRQKINLHNSPLPPKVSSYHKHHLIHLMSNSQKLLFFLSMLFPYPEDAEVLPLPRYLQFLYVPFRPLTWSWRIVMRKRLKVRGMKE